MSVRHWTWVMLGLLVWSLLVVLGWATTPTGCGAPNEHGEVVCTGKALLP